MHEEMGTEPSCKACLPELLEANEDAIKIFNICQGQVLLTSMGDIIDINLGTVIEMMNLYNIHNKKACLEKVRILTGEFLLKKDES